MGKKSGMSWLTLVKKAFRSSTKEHEKKCSRRREPEHDQQEEEDEEKKREKRRWLFRKNNNNHVQVQQCEASSTIPVNVVLGTEQRHAIELAAAAAEAAAVTAKAAADIVRFTRPPSLFVRENWAAIVIQTAFRGYLARRALRALKGLVKLQALVRGHNVRKQAKLTLKCMQALVRVQDRIRDQRAWLSIEGSRKSMFAESNGLWESRYFQDIRERRSMSRDVSSTIDDWDDRPQKSEEVEAMVQSRKQAALRREKALAYAFSSQIWRSRRNPSAGNEKELDERTRWLDRWMVTKQWESGSRASTDRRDTMMKTIEIDTSRTPQISSTPSARRSQHQNHHQNQPTPPSVASPLHRAHNNFCLHQSPMTPSPGKTKPLQVRSASPRLQKEEKCYSAAHTPSLSSRYSTNSGTGRYGSAGGGAANNDTTILPNYMAATESAKARIRPQSAPRQRPSTPERDRDRGGAAKKRLSYPAPEPLGGIGIGIGIGVGVGCSSGFGQNLRSPSFKSCHCGHFGIEQPSNFPSFYTESIGGEISPCSTTDLRWLK